MPREAPHRLTVTELDDQNHFLDDAIAASHQSADSVRAMVTVANDRLAQHLNLESPPLRLAGNALRVDGVVGVFRLSPSLELEIAPKYLGADDPHWREDFFFIATVSRFGRLFPRERLGAALTRRMGLTDLLARAVVEMYAVNQRRPLKTYRTRELDDFNLDGNFDAEDLLSPMPDGFRQSVTTFSRDNQHNQVIRTAAHRLLGGVGDPETRQQLVRVCDDLAPQTHLLARMPDRVPSRHMRWAPLYELAKQILSGFSLNMDPGLYEFAPGFVVRAAKCWEDLITVAAKLGLHDAKVSAQKPHALGTRNGKEFATHPDIAVVWPDQGVLGDAKYKGRADRDDYSVTAADVYESLAFLRAAGSSRLALLYPRRLRNEAPMPVGSTTRFELIEVGDDQIHAFEVEVRGISERNAMSKFGQRVGEAIRALRR